MRLSNILAVAALVFGIGVSDSHAYVWNKCGNGKSLKWSGNLDTLRASSVGFPVGPWRDALASVATKWNTSPTKMRYSLIYGDTSVALNNGQNEVWWQADPGAPAITYWWYNTDSCTFTETDIIFDNQEAYHYTQSKGSLWPYGGAYRPFQTTATHEFGHAQGLGHTANVYSVMGQDWDHIHANCGIARMYPGEDAIDGSVDHYGLVAGAKADVGVAHWRWTGSSGAYSTHDRTRLFNTLNIELSKWANSPEPIYRVDKGQTVLLEMSYENMGSGSVSADIGYYLSTNDCISTGDTFLGSGSVSMARDQVFTTSNTSLVIPANLTSGQTYWLGAYIDTTFKLNEHVDDGYENATYLAVRVN